MASQESTISEIRGSTRGKSTTFYNADILSWDGTSGTFTQFIAPKGPNKWIMLDSVFLKYTFSGNTYDCPGVDYIISYSDSPTSIVSGTSSLDTYLESTVDVSGYNIITPTSWSWNADTGDMSNRGLVFGSSSAITDPGGAFGTLLINATYHTIDFS
jgi:hypothetical protein